jgi:hypothetical protein
MYGILVDGLNKPCIGALAARLGHKVNTHSDRTLKMMKALLPSLGVDFVKPMAIVSEHRRRATHKVRPPAKPMAAFQTFSTDLDGCLTAVQLVRSSLEKEPSMDAKTSKKRQEELQWIPRIVRPPESNAASSVTHGSHFSHFSDLASVAPGVCARRVHGHNVTVRQRRV